MEMTFTAAAPAARVPQQADAAPLTDPAQAREFLDELMARVGVDGLVAALNSVPLRLTLDEHAAEVRTVLGERGLDVCAETLAGYGSLLLVAAQGCGRLLPADPGGYDWDGAEWYVHRLLAVCALAVELA